MESKTELTGEFPQLTRWVAASGGCTDTTFLLSFPLEPRTLGWKRKHDGHSAIHFQVTFYKK